MSLRTFKSGNTRVTLDNDKDNAAYVVARRYNENNRVSHSIMPFRDLHSASVYFESTCKSILTAAAAICPISAGAKRS